MSSFAPLKYSMLSLQVLVKFETTMSLSHD